MGGRSISMATVADILKTKGTQVWTISPLASIADALKLMADKNLGALVVAENELILGIFSERDYARKVVYEDFFSLSTPVRNLMTAPVYFVTSDEVLEACMVLMTEKRIRHLPVIECGRLIGLVSIGDVVKQSLSEMERTIKDLEDYIWVHMI
jgi:CBS domain-containing protein